VPIVFSAVRPEHVPVLLGKTRRVRPRVRGVDFDFSRSSAATLIVRTGSPEGRVLDALLLQLGFAKDADGYALCALLLLLLSGEIRNDFLKLVRHSRNRPLFLVFAIFRNCVQRRGDGGRGEVLS